MMLLNTTNFINEVTFLPDIRCKIIFMLNNYFFGI